MTRVLEKHSARSFVGTFLLLAALPLVAACSPNTGDLQACGDDADCPADYRCVSSGGVFFGESLCALERGASPSDMSTPADMTAADMIPELDMNALIEDMPSTEDMSPVDMGMSNGDMDVADLPEPTDLGDMGCEPGQSTLTNEVRDAGGRLLFAPGCYDSCAVNEDCADGQYCISITSPPSARGLCNAPDALDCPNSCEVGRTQCVGGSVVLSCTEVSQNCHIDTLAQTCASGICEDESCVPTCEEAEGFQGQMEPGDGSNGGVYSTNNAVYEANSGLEQVYTRLEAALQNNEGMLDGDGTRTLELVGPDKIRITGAVVTSTSSEQRDEQGNYIGATRFTFQDRRVGVAAVLDLGDTAFDEQNNPITLRVGHKISFTVSTLLIFGDTLPQIAALEDIAVLATDVSVAVVDVNAEDLSLTDNLPYYKEMVRVHGVVKAVVGPCGGSNICYDFEYGPVRSEKTVTLRRAGDELDVGDCGTFVGPLSSFPGYFVDESNTQLDAINPSWFRAAVSAP